MNTINIHYSNGDGELGKMMSNLANTPFKLDEGYFKSIESYWFWLQVDPKVEGRDNLRFLHGHECKRLGDKLRSQCVPPMLSKNPEFRRLIGHALKVKIANTPRLRELFTTNRQKFTHFAVYSGEKVDMAKNQKWWLDMINQLVTASNIYGDALWDPYTY